MYDWKDIAERVRLVYDSVITAESKTFEQRLRACKDVGPIAGIFGALLIAVDTLLLMLLQVWRPAEDIEIAPSMPPLKLNETKLKIN
jgi:hypothetical protein